jgi:hypothetical protein
VAAVQSFQKGSVRSRYQPSLLEGLLVRKQSQLLVVDRDAAKLESSSLSLLPFAWPGRPPYPHLVASSPASPPTALRGPRSSSPTRAGDGDAVIGNEEGTSGRNSFFVRPTRCFVISFVLCLASLSRLLLLGAPPLSTRVRVVTRNERTVAGGWTRSWSDQLPSP